MSPSFWYGIVAVVVLLIVGVIAFFGIMTFEKDWKPKIPPWENPDGSFKEVKFDSTIPTPEEKPALAQFGKAESDQPLWCIPTWYSVRYVDQNGNYGKLGPWSEEIVSSCSVPGLGCNSCNSFLPIISIKTSLSKYSANVHRQTKVFHPDIEGDVVGAFSPASNGWIFIDSENPNKDSAYCSGCTNCPTTNAACT
ncbi:hypothetical protein ISTM_197 [Insectomime virus]|uniref:Uncharacterized protein n=1 Tax=Tunisvirus fontaine2 TaxID=1421067 RepID=V9SDP1_9VIRU|nr:hypothetical protein D1R32_gp123 [Tunisvirus fontaine2]AHA46095.1 hypothetical protein ISTM_197 [Insectomime virus]AHC54840.1 hypothetical protein TNS_ORF122 [Tunisvirus fontaine2]